jgi:tRNA-2-methylthio-N6-dimethylallyladenosine synthase
MTVQHLAPARQRYYIWTVGCQMNTSDSERLEAALQAVGYTPAARPEDARFVVLNSCSVRASAEQRIIGKLGELQHLKKSYPDMVIVLWGCMVNADNVSPFQAQLPMVDHFVAPSAVDEVVALAPYRHYGYDFPHAYAPDSMILPVSNWDTPPVSVCVPIQYGCNMQCSYCVIPQRRGQEKSRPLAEICQEVHALVARGVKEIVLLGQIVDSWGHDLPERSTLSRLIQTIHDTTPDMVRLRFLTSHPAWMTTELIQTMARLPRCQREINLPIQAGHDDLLRRMRRGYTVARYRELVAYIRQAMPGCALTTDIIVGHPGETNEHFEHTVALVEELRFDKIHIAAYSPRPGTPAAKEELEPLLAVPEEEKERRRLLLEYHQKRIATEINRGLLGQVVEVLVMDYTRNKWRGRTNTNKLVFFAHHEDLTGHLVQVQITKTSPWSLQGIFINGTGTCLTSLSPIALPSCQ